MSKLGDLIKIINEHTNNNELEALAGASGVQEIEVQDETINEIKSKLSGLMSIDAARNNTELSEYFKKQLHPTIKGEILGNIDTDILQNTKSLFGEDAIKQFDGLDYTGDKIKKVFELAKNTLSSKSTDENLKKLNEDLKKQIAELSTNFETELTKKQQEIENKSKDFEAKLINRDVKSLLSNYKLGEKYQDDFIKESLYNKMFNDIQKKAKLTYNESGELIPRNPQNPDLELFEGNKKIESIRQLLDPLMEPYISKNPTVKVEYEKSKEPERLSALGRSFIRQRQEMKEN